ncbi:MAG: Fe-S cluster assembly protein HesB [Acidiphilium sp. 37-64-53]|uniref:HesB/IscA family protein n=1 Tax=Acidiphilium TaxID=522 RepID=UPI000BC3D063|nr:MULTISPECIES: iron-sulfur cluster assembly accessory protein [Acidiphilium]OYW04004.1 MAG: Fe-S cluster assembly protein HesB [Acidiphilium sp. 37-64-53]OZB29068.1 MAG: Fe-S cluster assembly protein HesB [Acidiphilium sp. 34-64-41]HQT83232.1 iron-sulfur cluster assembly accessory protein [Acidiphilium rubrum]
MSTMNTTETPKRRSLPPLMQLTEGAAKRLRHLYSRGEANKLLRIGVNTKGCSGMSYQMDWVGKKSSTDESVTDKDVTILIDRKATLFLIGTVMDYKEDKFTSGFTFENPNEKGRCGCGESFHI